MEYYKMMTDQRIMNRFVLKDFPGNESVEYQLKDADKLKDSVILRTVEKDDGAYPDVIEAPIYMVSRMVKDVITLYDETTVFKSAPVMNYGIRQLHPYYILLQDRIDCLHESTTFREDKSLIHLVLDEEKIGNRQIFKIAGIGPAYVIVSMDIAESILRRNGYGIRFEHVDVVHK